jgi:Ca2+/Na+ antiporter
MAQGEHGDRSAIEVVSAFSFLWCLCCLFLYLCGSVFFFKNLSTLGHKLSGVG